MTRADRTLATIEALLETQRAALLVGDLDHLSRMPDRLAQALGSLAGLRPSEHGLARVAALAAHNARLIEAAQRGLARNRDGRDADRRTPLSTYDALGRPCPTTPGGRLLSRG